MIGKYKKYMSKAHEVMYEHLCTVIEYKDVKDPITKLTTSQPIIIFENKPCRLSYENVVASDQTDSRNIVKQVIKLFISPDIRIIEGSKILVTHDGTTEEFKNSGRPAMYSSHQEIVLEFIGNA